MLKKYGLAISCFFQFFFLAAEKHGRAWKMAHSFFTPFATRWKKKTTHSLDFSSFHQLIHILSPVINHLGVINSVRKVTCLPRTSTCFSVGQKKILLDKLRKLYMNGHLSLVLVILIQFKPSLSYRKF